MFLSPQPLPLIMKNKTTTPKEKDLHPKYIIILGLILVLIIFDILAPNLLRYLGIFYIGIGFGSFVQVWFDKRLGERESES